MQKIWTEANTSSWAPGQNTRIYWDAASYFTAFIEACSQATHEILITGWDIHSETNLAPDRDGSWIPRRWSLNQFLLDLLQSKPELQIYLLCWDYAPIYLLEREKLQSIRLGWFSHPRMHFRMDGAHPVGASHHQKFVVVDGGLCFLGGLDLTIRRWDTCEHAARHPLRRDPQGQAYGPYHDVQLGLSGSLVSCLVNIFRERWHRATGESLPEPEGPREPLPFPSVPGSYALDDVTTGLSCTLPEFRNYPANHQIAQLYEDLLMGAQHQVILENQYLTSRHIVQILSKVLQKADGPEVVLILPETAGGWLEQKTMGLLQAQALYEIKKADANHRFHVFAPVHRDLEGSGTYITVHSKVALIDGRILMIGSANLNNRSMGLDSECNATLHLPEPSPDLVAHLLSHHTQGQASDIKPLLQQGASLREVIERLNQASPQRYLKAFPIEAVSHPLLDAELVDAEKPSVLEEGMDRWGQVMQVFARKVGLSSPAAMLGLGVVLLGLFLSLWYAVIQGSPMDHKRILDFFASTRPDSWLRHGLIPLTFAIGGLLFVPINLMIIATAALMPLPQALLHIVIGVAVNVSVCYATGHLAGRFIVRRFFGPRVREVLRRVGKGHFMTLVALRVLPVAPNSLINITAGVGRVPFWRFLGATLVGMGPGLLLLVVFQKSLFSVLKKPEIVSVLILVALVGFAVVVAQWSLRRFSHYGRS